MTKRPVSAERKRIAYFPKDNLLIEIEGVRAQANLTTYSIPADEVGPAHKKYAYRLSIGREIAYGWTKNEALQELLQVANENGWIVLHRLA
jgi:hypothetical protein